MREYFYSFNRVFQPLDDDDHNGGGGNYDDDDEEAEVVVMVTHTHTHIHSLYTHSITYILTQLYIYSRTNKTDKYSCFN